ncbi:hypothetical protein BpHYR1_029310 [Brachionus plicatilis]|uniref:Uncharacterized protein n=1 Tax=Brachionus plicatilis TaxID=10195 RepID=A0A3M7PAQ6_BRAPC|nr:hypothetical protein BpHYR1_029310 [Brachionus plicatilis]
MVTKNLLQTTVDIDYDKSLYELACEAAVLDTMFARNSFDLVKDCSVEVEVRLDKKLSVRQAVKELSIGSGQGCFFFAFLMGAVFTGYQLKLLQNKLKNKKKESK